MLEFRFYRLALLGALVALVVVMFSVVPRPAPVGGDAAPDEFDGAAAAKLARQLATIAPERRPGGRGDARAAEMVRAAFARVKGGETTVETYEGRFDGEGVRLRNVSLLLPGESDDRLVVAAPRDCAEGTCAASSAAATGALLELVDSFAGRSHQKTLQFVSLDGSAAGAAGSKRLAAQLEAAPPEAILVLGAIGAAEPRGPFVVPWSTGPQSTSLGLAESLASAAEDEIGLGSTIPRDTADALIRLAAPASLGDQGPLIAESLDAVALSASGDLPLDPGSDRLRDLSPATLDGFGRAALALLLNLDAAPGPPAHGPGAYLPLAGKLIPEWAISLLALALLLPVGLVSLEALGRGARDGARVGPALAWVLARALPFVAALVLAYALGEAGVLPRPEFPFDPARVEPDPGSLLAAALVLAAFAALALLLGRRLPPPPAAGEATTPAIGSLLFAALLAVWVANPFTALLMAPLAHLWLFASMPELRGRRAIAAVLAAGGLVVPLLAVAGVATQLGSGLLAPWDLLLMFTGRHFGPLLAIPLCVLGGCLLAILAAAGSPRPIPVAPARRARVLGPGYAGPGSLGGTGSAVPRR